MKLAGACHCRNLTFELTWEHAPTAIPARACTCSFCQLHGGVWTADRTASLRIVVEDAALVSRYQFGTRTADFHVCARCGVALAATSLIDDRLYAVVNVHALAGVDPALLVHAPATFDGEEVADRLARRARNWIPRVELVGY